MHTLLIDGNSLGMAAQNSNPLSSGGMPTQAIFGVMKSIHALMKQEEFQGSNIIVAWDGRSFRKDLDENYKANREENADAVKMRDEFRMQLPHIKKALYSLGITQMSAANLEADDLIAMKVKAAAGTQPITIISGDKDLLQLVGPNVTWHNPINYKVGTPSYRTVTEQDFADTLGYANPLRYVQGKALRGDASDNLAGVGKIGEKTALLILDHWGSVPAMIKDVRVRKKDAIPSHIRTKKPIVDFADSAVAVDRFKHNMRMMNLLGNDIPKPEGLKIVKGNLDINLLKAVCERHGFLSILRAADQWVENFQTREELKSAA